MGFADDNTFHVLVTGANGGLGLSIAHRLTTEFLSSRPSSQKLHLIITTRSASKGAAAITTLTSCLHRNKNKNASDRVTFSSVIVDLTQLSSVMTLSKQLCSTLPKLDVVILNAGMGAFTGIDWITCFRTLFTGWVSAVTYPTFKLQAVRRVSSQGDKGEIGQVFCANVFGHYCLVHEIRGLLKRARGRIIWISSLEAYARSLNLDDFEGLRANDSYESSKRLTDVLALTATLPATGPYTKAFLADLAENEEDSSRDGVTQYVSHPGICATAIVPLHIVLFYCMVTAFYIARLLGSPWHTMGTYTGALAPVFLALASDDELKIRVSAEGKGKERKAEMIKWGSGADRGGNEVLRITEVEGAEEENERWMELGRECWRRMEELRVEWTRRLGGP